MDAQMRRNHRMSSTGIRAALSFLRSNAKLSGVYLEVDTSRVENFLKILREEKKGNRWHDTRWYLGDLLIATSGYHGIHLRKELLEFFPSRYRVLTEDEVN